MDFAYDLVSWAPILWCSVQLLAGWTGNGVFYPGGVELGFFRRVYAWKSPVQFHLIMLANGAALALLVTGLIRS